MMKLTIILAAAAAGAGGLAILPTPAAAQQGNQSEVVVYGNDPCPRQTESNIVVCVHRPEQERYRLPKSQQLQGTRQERQSWASKSRSLSRVGATGIDSCSAVGPAGYTGCLTQQIRESKQESQEQQAQDTAPEQ
jgi:hypothetical protein